MQLFKCKKNREMGAGEDSNNVIGVFRESKGESARELVRKNDLRKKEKGNSLKRKMLRQKCKLISIRKHDGGKNKVEETRK